MPKENRVEFTVEGSGGFPSDMLRFDACWPRTQEDVAQMHAWPPASKETPRRRRVTLISAALRGQSVPTVGRWESFLWTIVPGSVKRYKTD